MSTPANPTATVPESLPDPTDADSRGLGKRLGMGGKPAVIVVDAVKAYVEPTSPLYLEFADQALQAMAGLTRCAREVGVPVLYTIVRYEHSANTEAPVFARKIPALEVFRRGSEWAEIHPAVAPESNELVLTKRYASGFFQTDLLAELQRLARDTLIIVGFSASGCVRATALDAIQYDFVPIVVREAVADRSSDITDNNLADLQAKYADVMQLGEVMQEMKCITRATDEGVHR